MEVRAPRLNANRPDRASFSQYKITPLSIGTIAYYFSVQYGKKKHNIQYAFVQNGTNTPCALHICIFFPFSDPAARIELNLDCTAF